ncbi:hypothetical protein MK851_09050 [Tenacibaculum sp. 1B UA]|uniref:hypothetical protein n=1 Tax=Tenacibaculum sp. 1B UA TaxID=2922252 RepID=UPI002A23D40E|nr:hypothetical protein [Tenacibaculum sp. 1B UA]MDX8553767.1 hypothetical protein [Tenacibaculum sp. 1B UA]
MSKKNIDKREIQLGEQIQNGLYGKEAIKDANIYKEISNTGIETFIKNINDFYSKEIESVFKPYPHALIEIILTLFFKNNSKDVELSDCFALIFQKKIEGTRKSYIKDKYINMLEAGHASKQSLSTNNPLIIWELTKNNFLAYNEFLNVLIGVILINYRYSIGKTYKFNTLDNHYGNKVNQLIELKPENQCYQYLFELLQPDIRNAIGHQNIWFEKSSNTVTYLNDKTGLNETMSIEDFILLNSKASYLAEAYLVSISTIAIFSFGTTLDRARLPKELFLLIMKINSSK